jgi:hypothetical protein
MFWRFYCIAKNFLLSSWGFEILKISAGGVLAPKVFHISLKIPVLAPLLKIGLTEFVSKKFKEFKQFFFIATYLKIFFTGRGKIMKLTAAPPSGHRRTKVEAKRSRQPLHPPSRQPSRNPGKLILSKMDRGQEEEGGTRLTELSASRLSGGTESSRASGAG